MAFLIPENIASRSDVSGVLQSIAKAFRDDVPDDVTVWLDQEGDAGEQYLTVLDPTIGIALIYRPPIAARDMTGGLFRRREVRAELPGEILERARSVRSNVSDTSSLPSDLPAVALVAVPAASERSLERLGLDRATTLIDDDFKPGALRPALARVLAGERPRSLTDSEERAARAVLKPEIVISGSLDDIAEASEDQLVFRPPEGEEDVIRVLDRQQERLAHHLGEGYRVIRGVAGSGKTLVLTFRAKWYAENFPNSKVLLTCYNRPLARALEHELAHYDSVTVVNIDRLAWSIVGRRVRRVRGQSTDERIHRTRILAAETLRLNGKGNYDVVLVDEAQDLDAPALDLAYSCLKPGRTDLVLALDGAQNVYRKNARWNPPGQTARGRTTVLRQNYRSTKEILEFGVRFLGTGIGGELDDAVIDDPTLVITPEAASRRGPKPRVLLCRDATAEAAQIAQLLCEAHDGGTTWSSMCVLYPGPWLWAAKVMNALEDADVPHHWVNRNQEAKDTIISAGDRVRIGTYQILKGLEFSRVFLCGVNEISDPSDGDEGDETIRRLVYVGMTRAMDELTITVSGNGPIGTAIQAASR
jgi:hypothetical protein